MENLKSSPAFVVKEIDNEILLYDPSTHKAIHLNETAAAIWKLCDGTRTVNDLVNCFLSEYSSAQSSIAYEVQEAVDLLLREGALVQAERTVEDAAARAELAARHIAAARAQRVESFVSMQKPAVDPLTAEGLAEIINGTWLNLPSNDWRLRSIGFQASVKRHSLIIPKTSSYRYGVDLSAVNPSVLETCALLVDDRFQQASSLPTLRVNSARRAVAALALRVRERYQGTICAVTGSVGKSSTCTLLHHAIIRQASCAPPQFGYNIFDGINTQIVNLSDERFAVLEVAVSALPRCSAILRPQLGVLTAVAPAHLEYTGTLLELAERKASIFAGLGPGGTAIINRRIPFYEHVSDIARQHAQNLVSYGDHPEAIVRLLDYNLEQQRVRASVHGEEIEYPLGMNGRHMAVNSLGALAALHAMGLNWRAAATEFGYVQEPRGRGRRSSVRIRGKRVLLIDDSYNANPASTSAALNLLAELTPSPGGRRIAVLADMLELGANGPRFHAELVKPIVNGRIDRLYVVGALMTYLWDVLPAHLRGRKVQSASELLPILQSEIADGDVILFKGSNAFNLFTVVRALRELDHIPVTCAETKASAQLEPFPTGITGLTSGLLGFSPHATASNRSRRPTLRRGTGTYTLTLCGDTSLGDYYLNGMRDGDVVYQRLCRAPESFFEHVKPLIADSDSFIANLETCLVAGMQSPFAGEKRYLGWDDPERTLRALKEIRITAVNLANNHTMDFGSEGLLETIARLTTSGIRVFGAGENREAASKPLVRRIEVARKLKAIYVIGAFATSQIYRDRYQYYAGASKPGVNPLSPQRLTKRIKRLRSQDPTALIIVCPHWHGNYVWASDDELELSSSLISAGADLVIGHGAHMLQQCHWSESGTLLLSLGNFIFNSPGRYAKFLAPPVSLIARLEISTKADAWSSNLKLYPILTDNLRTDFNVQPVDRAMLASIYSLLAEHAPDASDFRICFEPAEDERGLHIRLKRPISHRFVCT